MERFYYGKTIKEFLSESASSILGARTAAESFDTARDQKNAWNEEIWLLQNILSQHVSDIMDVVAEESIPMKEA